MEEKDKKTVTRKKKTPVKKKTAVEKEEPKEGKEVSIDTSSIDIAAVEGRLLLVNVGTTTDPANDNDIANVREELENLLKEHGIKCLVYVTHHAVDMKIVG